MTNDYQCKDCKTVQEYKKELGGVFPGDGELACPNCGSKNTARVWGNIVISSGGIDSATGQYFSSSLTPHNKQPGGVHSWDLTDY